MQNLKSRNMELLIYTLINNYVGYMMGIIILLGFIFLSSTGKIIIEHGNRIVTAAAIAIYKQAKSMTRSGGDSEGEDKNKKEENKNADNKNEENKGSTSK